MTAFLCHPFPMNFHSTIKMNKESSSFSCLRVQANSDKLEYVEYGDDDEEDLSLSV